VPLSVQLVSMIVVVQLTEEFGRVVGGATVEIDIVADGIVNTVGLIDIV